ncbi:chemotaxis protein CheB [Ramlibacter sp. 2FC]|uniref:chemotaxis protein CheB n=1 Tax=Ramlibacter sp. 2FC TaxID=2502188 RepID=UPI0010F57322|nr:chemotaxis protein CheB [Ramlibacter sp. 2FC]
MKYALVVIGASTGGLQALRTVLSTLPATFPLPIVVVQHRQPVTSDALRFVLQQGCALQVREAVDKQPIEPGNLYLAPVGYHLLVDGDHFALSTEDPVLFAQPSIDVLFESASESFGARTIGVILTGSSEDGARGLAAIRRHEGVALVECPAQAHAGTMPEAAKRAARDAVELALEEIGPHLLELGLKQ